jgi:hypothetical protein
VRSFRQGVGAHDAKFLDVRAGRGRLDWIAGELRRLELAGMELLADSVGPVARDGQVLHVGGSADLGRALRARFGDVVYPHDERWTGLADGSFDAVVDSDIGLTTDPFARCAEFSRLLRRRGRYVFATWCVNDLAGRGTGDIRLLNDMLGARAQPRARYIAALASTGFVPYIIVDLTRQAIPYWHLRLRSPQRTGMERAFLAAVSSNSASLVLMAAERSGDPCGRSSPPTTPDDGPAMVTRWTPPECPNFGLAYD